MNDACNAMMIFRVCGWSFKSFSLIKSWVQNWAVSYDPQYKESLSDALGFPTSITYSMIEGHMVNLRGIISRLIDKCTYGVTDNM